MHKGHGRLFVVTAPSGAGKTSLCRELIEQVSGLRFSISHTTRPPRPSEQTGQDYHFVDRPAFQAMIDKGQFAEWAEIHGNFYGTSVEEVEKAASEQFDLLLDIEGAGAMQVRAKWPESILIFVTTPTLEDLRTRLYGRHADSPVEIERRLANAKKEIAYLPEYDYVIVNKDFDEALLCLMSVIYAERSRREHVVPRLPEEFKPS
jgi:guanylate kinase